MDACFEKIPSCSLVVMTRSYGIIESSGTDAEINYAQSFEIPVFEFTKNIDKRIDKWLENKKLEL